LVPCRRTARQSFFRPQTLIYPAAKTPLTSFDHSNIVEL
jgi:hypothetical protein